MEKDELIALRDQHEKELREHVLPFWEMHSGDVEHGGYFSCLDRVGRVYDQDKFTWLQARQVWMFSRAYNRIEARDSWLDMAELGIKFLDRHGQDPNGHYYFSFTREGVPLMAPYNIYSECFAALAWHEYDRARPSAYARSKAKEALDHFLTRRASPKGVWSKATSHRSLLSFGTSMMTAYLAYEMQELFLDGTVDKYYHECIQSIMEIHYDESLGVIREHVQLDGGYSDTMDGRLINPGHGLEAIWFLVDVVERIGQATLMSKLAEMAKRILDYSWDEVYGGIYYFMDAKGAPPQQLEHDQKLWWVHLEALIALSRLMIHVDDEVLEQWYRRVHNYAFARFPDHVHGEWYGYLNRRGEVHLNLKGGKWKGCFHVPRALLECTSNFNRLIEAD
ncbi:MAG: AGE family epimerase/isomerase [Saprospiraceae bacterium]|nr:AGE family epimerase/isomerase [Saprospiraceae bacterium]